MKIRKYWKELAAGILSAAILAGSALAANVTATTDVNMRKGPGNSYSVVCVIPKNQTADKLDTSGNWYKVSYNGKTGYVYKSYLKDEAASVSTVYTTANLNVRSTASTSGNILGTLKKGTEVKVKTQTNGWYEITYNGKTAYICAKYTTTTKPTTTTTTMTVYTTDSLNVRTTASTSGKIMGTLKKGAEIKVVGEKNGWYQITYNGKTGYVSAKYTTTTKPVEESVPTATTVYTTANLNVRTTASTSGNILGTLKKGTAVKIAGQKNGWYQITYNGKTGYISKQYTTTTKPSGTVTDAEDTTAASGVVYTTANLNVRGTAAASGVLLGTLPKGTEVKVFSEKNGWYQIRYNSQTGYISKQYTTVIKPGSKPAETVTQTTKIVYTTDELNIRSEPSTKSAILAVYAKGAEVTVTGEKNGWYIVDYNGKTGYIGKGYTTTKKP